MRARGLRGSQESVVTTFRKFDRFYTALIGTLSIGSLETPYSLQEARVIFEVATNPGCKAKDIQLRVRAHSNERRPTLNYIHLSIKLSFEKQTSLRQTMFSVE